MAIKIGSNFFYNGKLPNFERDSFETKAAMKAFDENSIDEGHLSYCKEDGNIYQYKSANSTDATTGRWRIFKTDIVVDATLNGTSINPIQNKAVFDALKLKADAVALDKYQPKYKADYVAKTDLSELPITKGILDLNGHSINASFSNHDGELTIQNGTILNIGEINAALHIINCTIKSDYVRTLNPCQITFNNSSIERLFTADDIHCRIFNSNVGYLACDCKVVNIYNSTVDELTCYTYGYNTVIISNSYISTINYDHTSQPKNDGSIYLYNCGFETLDLDSYPRSIDIQLCSCCDYDNDVTYVNGYYDKIDGLRERAYIAEIQKGSDIAPTTNAVYEALQLKADKTQLNGLATKTELNSKADASELDNYTTTATTNAISADVTSLMNEVFVLTATASVSPNIAEVGTNPTVTLTVDAKLGKGRTQVDEITIDGTKYTGEIPYTHSATATTTHTYNITVKKGTKTANASATINFYNASYYGVVDASKTSLTATEVKTLKTKEVKSGRSGTRTFNLTNQKACIAYPKSFGAAASIKDANGFDYLASYTRNEVTIDSVVYYVYLLSSPTTITDFKQIIN